MSAISCQIYANTLLGKLLEFILIAFWVFPLKLDTLAVSARPCRCLSTRSGHFIVLRRARAQHKNFHFAFDTTAIQKAKEHTNYRRIT